MPLTAFYKYNAAGYKYNSAGYVIETEFYTDKHHLIFLRTYQYDKNNLITQDNTYSNFGRYRAGLHFNRKDSREYLTIDSKKNWTKMIAGADTVTRKIIYY
nr:hypothetical protein [Mucilaginibacter sp. L294]